MHNLCLHTKNIPDRLILQLNSNELNKPNTKSRFGIVNIIRIKIADLPDYYYPLKNVEVTDCIDGDQVYG